jgi:predicted DNA-binding protein (MmcQ/YjbR family)
MAKKNATDAIRLKASRYPQVDEGTACTQSSFKAGKKAFLFIGQQGGRHKAMFKLEAEKLAKKQPADFQVGSTAWVTARFSDDEPLPKELWQKWLDESYQLSVSPTTKKKTTKKKTTKKKTAKKKTAKKKAKTKKKIKKKTS